MLQIALSAVKLHLPAKQFLLILSVFLLLLINGVKPQVEAGKMIIHVMVEVGCPPQCGSESKGECTPPPREEQRWNREEYQNHPHH